MPHNESRVTTSLDNIAQVLRDSLRDLASAIGHGTGPGVGAMDVDGLKIFSQSISDPSGREELLIRYTDGTLEFVEAPDAFGLKRRYGLLRMNMFKMDGTPDGSHQTVWIPLVTDQVALRTVDPPNFEGPFDRASDVFSLQPRAQSKAVWTFANGDAIYATGPANLLLVPFRDGSQSFLVSVMAVITGGEGKYKDCLGVKTALGSSFVPQGVKDLDAVPLGQAIRGVTVEAFRVITRKDIY